MYQANYGELIDDHLIVITSDYKKLFFRQAAMLLSPGCMQERDQALQKRAYKLLAHACEARPAYLRSHLQAILDALLAGVATALSAAKRWRLRCLQAVILLLQQSDAPHVTLDGPSEEGAPAPSSRPAEQQRQASTAPDKRFLTQCIIPSSCVCFYVFLGCLAGLEAVVQTGWSYRPHMLPAYAYADQGSRASFSGRSTKAFKQQRTFARLNARLDALQVVSALVGEIVLCVKEVNQKTRAAAFELLVSLARRMHETDPPSISPADGDASMGESFHPHANSINCDPAAISQLACKHNDSSAANGPMCDLSLSAAMLLLYVRQAANSCQKLRRPLMLLVEGNEAAQAHARGGLATLLSMVLGGLIGTTPHMVSAAVMALARLLHEFAPLLETAAPRLLATVLMLLRSKSRVVIKSVLGFCKVSTALVLGLLHAGLTCICCFKTARVAYLSNADCPCLDHAFESGSVKPPLPAGESLLQFCSLCQ